MSDVIPFRSDESAGSNTRPARRKAATPKEANERALILNDPSRSMPWDSEAEKGILSCFLNDPNLLDEAAATIRPEAFYHPMNQLLYRTMLDRRKASMPIEYIALTGYLRDANLLDKIGGVGTLSELLNFVPTPQHFGFYRKCLKSKLRLRETLNILTTGVERCYEIHEHEDVLALPGELSNQLCTLEKDDAGAVIPFSEYVAQAIERYDESNKAGGKMAGFSTGFPLIDRLTGGMQRAHNWVIGGGTSDGKAQPLDAMILTPHGFVPMGTIKPGMDVIGADGLPHRVINIFPQGSKSVFRVTLNDGTSTECCDDHLWLTKSHAQRKHASKATVKSLSEIRQKVTLKGGRLNHELPTLYPVRFHNPQTLPLAPWAMGALLGDGCLTGGNLRFFNVEKDVVEKMRALLPMGDTLVCSKPGHFRIKRAQRNNTESRTKQIIKWLGLDGTDSQTKFVPKEYKFASVEDRLELLQGLFDTDGSTLRGMLIDYSTCSKRLADDVVWIVQSLGGCCRVSKRIPSVLYKGHKVDGALSYRIMARLPKGMTPISSVKNLQRWKGRNRGGMRLIENVEEVGEKECQCIQVEGGLYVTDNFIVTHNTALAMNFCKHLGSQGIPSAYYFAEMKKSEFIDRWFAMESKVPSTEFMQGLPYAEDIQKVSRASLALGRLPIYLREARGWTDAQVCADVRRLARTHGVAVVFVDYVQKYRHTNKNAKTREQEVASMSVNFTTVSGEEQANVCMVLLSQVNSEGKLRESESIGFDADRALMLRKKLSKDKKSIEHKRQLDFPKVRGGRRHVHVDLDFDGSTLTFTESEEQSDPSL